jgi:outer membrane protein assembly factor BamE (lipoprotein component of BamABCDE complex)
MKKKWLFAVAMLIVLSILLAIGVPAFLPPPQGITYANFSRIQMGMTRDEVVAILGRPNVQDHAGGCAWRNDDGDTIIIEFDRAGLVHSFAWNDFPEDRNVWQKLRDRVPWLAKPPPRPELLLLNVL